MENIRSKLLKKYGYTQNSKTQNQTEEQSNVRENIWNKYKKMSTIDNEFISQFERDSNQYLTNAQADFKGLSWDSAVNSNYAEQHKEELDDLRRRSQQIRSYMDIHRDSFEQTDYDNIVAYLDAVNKGYSNTENAFAEAKKYYSQFESQQHHDVMSMSLEDLEGRNTKAKDNAAAFDDAIKVEEERWGKLVASGIDDGSMDYQKALDEHTSRIKYLEEERDKASSPIAYTTKSGENITWEGLYELAKNTRETENLVAQYQNSENWSGVGQLADSMGNDFQELYRLMTTGVPLDQNEALRKGFTKQEYFDALNTRHALGQKYGIDLTQESYDSDKLAELTNNVNFMSELTSVMSDDEKRTLMSLFLNEGYDAAMEYYNQRRYGWEKEKYFRDNQAKTEWAKENGLAASAASVGYNALGAIETYADTLRYSGTDEKYLNSTAGAANALRSGVMQSVDWNFLGTDWFDFLYGTGMSMLDSRLAMYAAGPFSPLVLSLSAAGNATNDAFLRGLDRDAATSTGLVAGIAEYLWESVSFGNLEAMKQVPSSTWKDLGKNWLKSMGVNATEELATELTNIAYDTFANGDLSQFETDYRTALSNGKSESEAWNEAFSNAFWRAVEAAGSGALMGMGDAVTGLSHAATSTVRENYGNYKQQKAVADVIAADQIAVEQLQAQAKTAVDGNFGGIQKGVQKRSDKVTENASKKNVRQLYKSVQKAFNAQDQADIITALEATGMDSKKAKQLAKAIALDSRGARLTDAQNEMLFEYGENKAVQKVVRDMVVNADSSINQRHTALNSIVSESALRQEFEKAGFSKEASDIFAKVFVADQNNRQLTKEEQDILESIEQDPTVQKAIQAAQEAESTENFTTAKQVFDNVKQTYSGVNNVIADVSEVDRAAMLQVYDQESNGNEVRFAGAMLAAYSYGYENQDIGKTSKLQDSVLLQSLTEPQRMFAWKLGRDAAMADANKRKDQLNTTYKKAQEANQAAKKEPARYGAVQDQSMIGTQLKGERLASYKLADKIAKAVKTTVVAYKGGTEWGYYDHSTDRIHINVDAKWSEKTMMLFTLGHELVHRAKAGSPTQYQAFADFLIAEYGKRGADVDAMIVQQINASDGQLTRDQAFDEVVAEACQRMLIDTNAGQKLAQWGAQSQQNKNIVQNVVQWIKDLFAKLRSYYKNVDPDSLAAQEFMKLDKQVQKQLADMFVKMSVEAGQKLSTIKEAGLLSELNKNTAPEGGRQYKLVAPFTDNKGVHYDSAVLLDTAFFDGLSPRNWGTKLRDFVRFRAATEPLILPVLDEKGNIQQLEFAKPSDRVKKTGKADHAVLSELSSGTDNISKLAVVHIDEIVDISEEDIPYHTAQDPIENHSWLDKDGWLHRTAYVINAKNGNIYQLTFDVAKADDGRHILYATKGKIKRVGSAKVGSLKARGPKQNSNSNGRISQTDPEVKRKDLEYQYAVSRGDLQTAQKMVLEKGAEAGFAIRAYHGTARGDRVGNVFLPERATSGPMSFFTDNKEIAEHYARDKKDTSLAYDEEYADYYSQFRVNQNGKNIKVQDLWRSLPFAEKQRLKEAGKHITWDEDMENIVWDDSATSGLGNWDAYTLNQHNGNAIEALIDSWLESGELWQHEGDFLKVLELAGIKGVEYRDPDARHEKVYDTLLKIQNPFDTANVDESFVEGFEEWYSQQPEGKYDRDTASADWWDKNNQTAETFAERLRNDIEEGTTHAWTSIPDSVTDYLKYLKYDGIKDTGGKQGGTGHTVWIPFSSEQIKSAEPVTYDDKGNVIPLSERFNPAKKDIRYKRPMNDSVGRDLSEGQQEFFAESQARTLSGALASLFHGTENGGFTIFDPQFSDDKMSLFMTDNIYMAATYSNSTELLQLAKGKPKFLRWMEGDATQGKGQRGVYNVYANLKNPLIVDAKGENWNKLSSSKEYQNVRFQVELESTENINWSDVGIRLTIDVDGYAKTLRFGSVQAMNKYIAEDFNTALANNISIAAFNTVYGGSGKIQIKWNPTTKTEGWQETTREIAKKAKDQGYDGVIIKNVFDSGKYGKHDANEMGNVYIAFDSNQIKDVNNKKPTDDPDIRYKMPVGKNTQKQLEVAKEQLEVAKERMGRYMDEVRGLKDDVKVMEKEFARIVRVFETQARRSGKKDVKIADLREALKAETKKHRADQRVWEAEFDRLMKEYDRSGRQIEKLEEKIQQQRQAAKDKVESRRATEVRHKIIRFKERLQSALRNPTDSSYVPVDLINTMIEVCNLINTEPNLYKSDGSLRKNADVLERAYENRMASMKQLQELQEQVNALEVSEMYKYDFDEQLKTAVKELIDNFGGKALYELNRTELEDMYRTLKQIEEFVQDAKRMIGFADAQYVHEVGDAIFAEQAKITEKRKNGKRSAVGRLNDKRIDYTLSPIRNVERMSGWKPNAMLVKLFHELEKGIHKKDKFRMDSYKMFEALSSGKEYEDALYNPASEELTDINGWKFRLSKMQMMQAILSYEREVANDYKHIQRGGFTFAELNLLKKGKIKEAVSDEFSHRVNAAASLAESFADALKNDQWCQAYMAVARKFFNETAKNAINETTVQWKHRMIATDKAYIPYEVDKSFVNQEISAEHNIQKTISAYGSLKAIKDGSSQPLYITGLNNIIDRHIDQVATVYGLAIPVRNFNMVWNMKSASHTKSVKGVIETNWGESGVNHITQAVQDIQGKRTSNQSVAYKNLKSKYVGAKFMLNPSIVMKQIGSLYAARAMLKSGSMAGSLGNLLYTMTHHKAIAEEVNKYTASAWVRRQGVSDAELSSLLTETQRSLIGKAAQKLPTLVNPAKWIATMDYMVALSLWKYAKMDVAKRTGLEGEELLKATAEYYDQVIDNTQSMSDVLHRPEVQKAGNAWSDMFGMFKTDLYQMAGQLQMTAGRFLADKNAENFKALAKTVAGTMASAIWGNLMTVAFAVLFYKVNPFRDDDEEVTWESLLKRTAFSFGGDVLSYFAPMSGGELVDIFEQIYYGESNDAIESIPVSVVNNLIGTVQDVAQAVGEGKEIGASTFKKLITQGLEFFGVPASNAIKIFDAIKLWGEDIENGEAFSFEAGANRSAALSYYLDLAEGDTKEATRIYNEMLDEKIADGYLKHEAEDAIASELTTQIGKHYMNGQIDREDALEMLKTYADRGQDEIKKWDFELQYGFSWSQRVRNYRLGEITAEELADAVMDIEGVDEATAKTYIKFLNLEKQYPDISLTAADAEGYFKYAQPANIKVEVYMDYKTRAAQCKGEKDENGDTISGSVKEEIMDLIDSLPLSKAQKDALYLANGWAESKIKSAPWH